VGCTAETLEVQTLSRLRSDHVQAKGTVINQLPALLGELWPGARRLFKNLDSEIAMAFLDRFPTPQHLAEVLIFMAAGSARRRSCWCCVMDLSPGTVPGGDVGFSRG
jgi:hypothetical protein